MRWRIESPSSVQKDAEEQIVFPRLRELCLVTL